MKDSFNRSNIGIKTSDITEICFETSAPSGYEDTGLKISEIPIYKNDTKIAFVYPTNVKVQSTGYDLFSGMSKLNKFSCNNLYIGDCSIRHMFSGCTSLEELDLSGISISEMCLVDDMFYFGTENKIKIFKTPKSI